MRPLVNVARLHAIRPLMYLGLPWAITAFSLAVNLVIFGAGPVSNTHRYTGAASITFIFFLFMGVSSVGRTLPFGMALGVSRRSYYLGTALLAVTLAALDGLALTILQAIERGSGGWGIALHFFRVPYILDGPWYLTWLTSFVGLALLFGYGMWLGPARVADIPSRSGHRGGRLRAPDHLGSRMAGGRALPHHATSGRADRPAGGAYGCPVYRRLRDHQAGHDLIHAR